ncbi:MAG TPA: hypothetical protein VMQ76_12060 [Terracidiphilus sp.]|jgi:hypothetical protein|nr:hypothetical protein [Terracidiphilus sp.]
MMFGRRQGEILFRPVVGVELLLAGDPPKHKAMHPFFAETARERWLNDLQFARDGDKGDAFKTMYTGEWATEPEPLWLNGLQFDRGGDKGDKTTYVGIDRASMKGIDLGNPISADPHPRTLYGCSPKVDFLYGSSGGGKTARLDDYYRDKFGGYAPPRPTFQAQVLPPSHNCKL